ncbi:hypothetical protein B0T14DRAFT_519668 [Immersiella caudata]|uniref:Uncharacterized protein n=1 Tax=Immersiella caudata TaxID=314043 RepID=A0AA39WQD9_9PEZI|nr:hypothetical protein B0T14DRAFT_519668 [Immersiella caudata]
MAGAERSGVTPDYTLSKSRVFQIAITDMITGMELLDPITGEFSTKYTAELPSWASDWSTTYEPVDRVRLENIQHYRASSNCQVRTLRECGDGTFNEATQADDATCLRDHGHGLISVLGRDVDTVVAIGDPKFPDAHVFSVIASWTQLVSRCFRRKDGGRDVYHDTGDSLDEAFRRTICGDLLWDGTTTTGLTSDGFRRIKATDNDDIKAWVQTASSNLSWGTEGDGACGVMASSSVSGTYSHESRQPTDWSPSTDRVSISVRVATSRRRFFTTSSGFMGLGPIGTSVGDRVYVLFGGKTPFILRRVESGERVGLHHNIKDIAAAYRADCKVIGDCYVHGIMDGEKMPYDPTASIDFAFHRALWDAEIFTWWHAEETEAADKNLALAGELDEAARDWADIMRTWGARISVDSMSTLMAEALALSQYLEKPESWSKSTVHSIKRVEEVVNEIKAFLPAEMSQVKTISLGSDDHKQWVKSIHGSQSSETELRREKRILEARSRLQGIEVQLLNAEEQLRAANRAWDEIIYRCRGLIYPMSNTEVQEAQNRRRELVLTWGLFTRERQKAAEELRLLHTYRAEPIVTSEYQLKIACYEWLGISGMADFLSTKKREALKTRWFRWFDEWMGGIEQWRSGTLAMIKRQPNFHDLETKLYEAEGRLLQAMDDMRLTEERVRRASSKIEKTNASQSLEAKGRNVQARSQPGSTDYVCLV